MELPKQITEKVGKIITEYLLLNRIKDATILHNDDTITKNIGGKIIRKQSCRRKGGSYDWVENIKTEEIDTLYFNLDFTRKNGSTK